MFHYIGPPPFCQDDETEAISISTPIPPPKVWAKEDIPTPPEMDIYLGRIRAVRDTFPNLPGLPELPESMSKLTYEAANDLERVLLAVDNAVTRMEDSWFFSGEIDSGGV